MQFTKLRLTGFKSFVDATELNIEPGVTGVVGPNGCGKSNFVEAIKWVMGETSAKQVRGKEMDDVIFSGTVHRPARNIAEVALAMDNTDRTAPAEFNEFENLEVIRRIEREKGSTYKVNAKEVRARDIHLLFADQASGARSTALVSQGHVNDVVSAKPTDRRKLLEEAAGITGLNTRRHEAELRLRGAETNLERLDDILVTLEAQMQSLRRQVRQSKRYRNINDHIRKAEATLFLIHWNTASEEMETARRVYDESEQQVTQMTSLTSAASTKQAEISISLPRQRQDEAEAAAALQRIALALESLEEEEARLDAARKETEARLNQTSQDVERECKLISDCGSVIANLKQEHQKILGSIDDQGKVVEQVSQDLDAAQSVFDALDIQVSSAINQLGVDEARRQDLLRRHSEVEHRVARLQKEKQQLGSQVSTLTESAIDQEALSKLTAELEATYNELEQARNLVMTTDSNRLEATKHLNAMQNEAQKALSEVTRLGAEEKALAEVLETGDPDLWRPLVDALEVEAGYEAALGAALGDDLSAPTDEAAPVHWTSLPSYDNAAPLPRGLKPLSDHVSGSPALARRLCQIGVIKDSDTGRQFANQLKQGQRLVTLDGGFWRWDGYTATSEAPSASAVRLVQRKRLKEIRQQLTSANSKAAESEIGVKTAKSRVDHAVQQEAKARKALQHAELTNVNAQKTFGELQQRALETDTKLSARQEALLRVVTDLDEVECVLAETIAETTSLPNAVVSQERVDTLRSQASEARSTLIDTQSKYDNLQRLSTERAIRLQTITEELTGWADRNSGAELQLKQLESRRRALLIDLERVSTKPNEIKKQRAKLLDTIETAEAGRQKAADQLAISETKLAEADKSLREAESQLADFREKRVRAEASVDQANQAIRALTDRIGDRLDCLPEDLREVSALKEHAVLPEFGIAEKRVERLVRERENMGPVNLRAESESQELTEQIESLNTEREDLLKAIGKLRRGINELNREGRQRLLVSFEEVDKHFQELFVRLFGGGRAHLTLIDSDDPLEAGIEIMASPPGKRLQVLSLLSGGEQALTALALLFGVFLTNPAPICVLDEVDAPLDDTNVDRFCSLVDEIAHSLATRFIVVTHHRMTMSRMDRLFGITMGEQGVSQLVSVDLGVAMELREIA